MSWALSSACCGVCSTQHLLGARGTLCRDCWVYAAKTQDVASKVKSMHITWRGTSRPAAMGGSRDTNGATVDCREMGLTHV